MTTLHNNRTVLDLAKVQHGTLVYVNQYGHERSVKPAFPTSFNTAFDPSAYALPHHDYPRETMMERAIRLDTLDKWVPIVRFQLTANHIIAYSGAKALSLWAAWRERIFNR